MQFQTFPLTQTQTHALPRLTAAGNRCAVYQLEGPLDETRLELAIQTTLRRCPPLSYKCLKLDGGLQIMQSQDEESPLQIIDVASDDALFTLIENYRRRTFRLDGGAPISSACCAANGSTTCCLSATPGCWIASP